MGNLPQFPEVAFDTCTILNKRPPFPHPPACIYTHTCAPPTRLGHPRKYPLGEEGVGGWWLAGGLADDSAVSPLLGLGLEVGWVGVSAGLGFGEVLVYLCGDG